MGNRTTRRPGSRRQTAERPSTFFFLALAIGILLLIWLMSKAVTAPMTPVQKTTTTTSRTSS